MKLFRILSAAVILCLHIVGQAQAGEATQEIVWLPVTPISYQRTETIQCNEAFFDIKFGANRNGRFELVSAMESGRAVKENVFDAIQSLISSFERIDSVSASCGASGVTIRDEQLNYGGAIELIVKGRSRNESNKLFENCWLRRGYYRDSVEAAAYFSNNEVYFEGSPGTGECITEFGPMTEIGAIKSVGGAGQ